MVALWVIVMAVGLIGMIVCSKKQKTNPAMQPVAIVLFLVVLAGAFMLLKEMDIFGGGTGSIIESEMRFAESRGAKVAKYVAGIAGGKKVLFIADKSYDQSDLGKRVIEIFKENCGDNFVIDSIAVPKNMEESGVPVEEFMKAKDMDALLAKHTDAAVIISNIGLPSQDAGRMAYFKAPAATRAKLILLNTGYSAGLNLYNYVKKGDIEAIVVTAPNVKYDVKAPKDLDEAFAIRYILLTKANLEQYKNQLPQ